MTIPFVTRATWTLALATMFWFQAALGVKADTFQVTNLDDSGPGSLRQALLSAGATAGPHRIEFQIATGPTPYVIRPLTQLPDVRGPIVMDASTQDGYAGLPVVELQGDQAGASDGLRLAGGFCEVRGLIIDHFQRAGIRVLGGTNVIQGNFIGVDPTGKFSMGNGEAGVDLFLGDGSNLVGGSTFLDRNVISGNRWGIYVLSPQNRIHGNYIGVDADGLYPLGNGTGIALVRSVANEIGGGLPGQGNVISGNASAGIELIGGATDGPAFNIIQGNVIGLDAAGAAAVPNGQNGIVIGANAATNQIGGTTAEARNILSGNVGSGVVLQGSKPGNQILGNFIGTDRTGSLPVPNVDHGLRILAPGQIVGGADGGAGNWIAFNGRSGVAVEAGAGNTIQGNRIFSNGSLGIVFGINGGPSVNDPGDTDDGPNGLQNYPELRFSQLQGDQLTVGGAVLSLPDRSYVVEFFGSPDCDSAGAGEGYQFLGRTNVVTASNGTGLFSIVFSNSVTLGWKVTATATDGAGNTSEFSPCLPVSNIALSVPVFVEQPVSQAAVIGGRVVFSASLTGDPAPFQYELRRGSVSLLTNVSNERFVFFTLTNLSPASAGSYRIVVTSPATSSLGVSSSAATLSLLIDTDNDGLPDVWETAFGLTINNAADASLDLDADGLTNLQEYNAGTNPTNSASRLQLMALRDQTQWLLQFNAESHRTYTIQTRDNLGAGSWSNLSHWVARPNAALVTLTNPSPAQASAQFYRLLSPAQP